MSNVVIVCPNARRVQVPVTPVTVLRKVLEDGCLKSGFDVNNYELKTQSGKTVDLSLTWRLSGFPNNVTFEMYPRAAAATNLEIEIVLQHSNGKREAGRTPVSANLFDLLSVFSPKFEEDLTTNLDGTVPCIVFMNKTYTGDNELRATTLASLGIASKCLLRYQRRRLSPEELAQIAKGVEEEEKRKLELKGKFEQLKKENLERERIEADRQRAFDLEAEDRRKREEEASKELLKDCEMPQQKDRLGDFTLPNRDILPEPPRSSNATWSFDAHTFSRQQPANSMRLEELNRLLERVDSSLSGGRQDLIAEIVAERGRIPLSEIARTVEQAEVAEEMEQEELFAGPCDRKPMVYAKKTERVDEPMELEEEFFQVQIDDVKVMQKDLRNQVKMQSQQAFVSKTSVEKKNRASKLKSYEHTVIRIVAGTHVLQLCFNSAEPSSRLVDEVKLRLREKTDFKLFCASLKLETSESKNFVDVALAPKSTVILRLASMKTPQDNIFNIEPVDFNHANGVSEQWLAKNTTYSPYVATVEERSVFKRPSRPTTDGEVSPHSMGPPAKAALPKWMSTGKK